MVAQADPTGPASLGGVLRILGPMSPEVGPPRRRLLLAVLLVEADRTVPFETLVARLWDDQAPCRPRAAVHGHVTRLRRTLRHLGTAAETPVELQRQVGGYRLRLDPQLVDLHRITAALESLTETSDPALVRRRLAEVLEPWTGTPLGDLPGTWARQTRTSLTGLLRHALARWGRACLQLGRTEEVLDELRRRAGHLCAETPDAAERLEALLDVGQVAEALALVDPAPASAGPPHPTPEEPPAPPRAPRPDVLPVPAQLPCDIHPFLGRETELAAMNGFLEASRCTSAVTVLALVGTAGVGKTALAVHWAHRVAGEFPDGALYVDLRGYDLDRPISPAEALAGLLGALGVRGQEVPFDLAERAAAYRSLLAGRRVLVILDNASSADQVRPLLPGVPTCLAAVTSRNSLADLVAVNGAERITVDLLSPDRAVGLMTTLIGDRAHGEAAAVTALAERCGCLPLALRVAAELASLRGDAPLTRLAAELADEGERLALMKAGGDPRVGVEAVFSWSYRHLDEDVARHFRFLGMLPGADWGVLSVAALCGTDPATAARALEILARAHLVQRPRPGRYGMHDLLRLYAHGLCGTTDAPARRQQALDDLLDHTVASAALVLDEHSPRRRPPRPTPPTQVPPPAVDGAPAARQWFAGERAGLVRLVAHAADHDRPGHAVHLAEVVAGHLEDGGHLQDALTVHDHACRAARAEGDLRGQAQALVGSGAVLCRWGRVEEGARHLREAVACARDSGAVHAEACALHNLAFVEHAAGRAEAALDLLHRTLPLWERTDDRLAQARTLYCLGLLESERGEYQRALDHLTPALDWACTTGERRVEAEARDGLGSVLTAMGHHAPAADHFEAAMRIWGQEAAPEAEALVMAKLGRSRGELGDPEAALGLLHRSLDFNRRSGFKSAVADILTHLGHVHRLAGQLDEALERHQQALDEADRHGSALTRARAHDGFSLALGAAGRGTEARAHGERALALFEEFGDATAAEVRSRLEAAPHPPGTSRNH